MSDKLLREIRDRLTAIAALLVLLVVLVAIATGIIGYWHVKADALRGRAVTPAVNQSPRAGPFR